MFLKQGKNKVKSRKSGKGANNFRQKKVNPKSGPGGGGGGRGGHINFEGGRELNNPNRFS